MSSLGIPIQIKRYGNSFLRRVSIAIFILVGMASANLTTNDRSLVVAVTNRAQSGEAIIYSNSSKQCHVTSDFGPLLSLDKPSNIHFRITTIAYGQCGVLIQVVAQRDGLRKTFIINLKQNPDILLAGSKLEGVLLGANDSSVFFRERNEDGDLWALCKYDIETGKRDLISDCRWAAISDNGVMALTTDDSSSISLHNLSIGTRKVVAQGRNPLFSGLDRFVYLTTNGSEILESTLSGKVVRRVSIKENAYSIVAAERDSVVVSCYSGKSQSLVRVSLSSGSQETLISGLMAVNSYGIWMSEYDLARAKQRVISARDLIINDVHQKPGK